MKCVCHDGLSVFRDTATEREVMALVAILRGTVTLSALVTARLLFLSLRHCNWVHEPSALAPDVLDTDGGS